ncbi:Inactive serine/threonine-protein kinase/endoribonuclease IRE1-like [Seminavis robusta]|uniref:non-specific serine/threonine protein kinase n=1 Tax=Seminavis robusta TaxID=568900 RepID=A0A9N8EG36_9STRA|nr:Inactive serine/threonine-protein kinase/endoribonuclease IRE1-like [Seminavis robusta]|eukprot:Sro1027_g233100.1 Inactive serine/threonine-protein kinase/endoribonuclease IRE1-like (1516) ;mRNA; f:28923-33470
MAEHPQETPNHNSEPHQDEDSSLVNEVVATPCHNKSGGRSHPWTPTLRGASLLSTLLFLSLALSQAKIQTASSTASEAAVQQANRQTAPVDPQPSLQISMDDFISIGDDDDDEIDFADLGDDSDSHSSSSNNNDNDSSNKRKELIIVAAVDGTIAAVDKETGKVLWKQNGGGSSIMAHPDETEPQNMKLPRHSTIHNREEKLLQPLVTTTTTASSSKRTTTTTTSTAAIPSIDGSVFLTTTVEAPNDTSVTRTDTASVRELVDRAPYVDPHGRFYVGSRQTTVAALDGDTGEILYVASADDDGMMMKDDPQWEGRNIIWIGRVDYKVSVYNAKSSHKEVQFSASEILSVNDMVMGRSKAFRRRQQQQNAVGLIGDKETSPFSDHDDNDDDEESALVATPSGNLAFRNRNTETVEWVADLAFDAPIAYAIHSSSGQSMDVDIIPDVTNPANSKEEYLRSEIERQIELTLLQPLDNSKPGIDDQSCDCHGALDRGASNPSIVGVLLNGQLYSMPLGRPTSVLPSHASLATTRTQADHVLLDVTATSSTGDNQQSAHSNSGRGEGRGLARWIPLGGGRGSRREDEKQLPMNSGNCRPSSVAFPGCLFKAVSQGTFGFLPRRNKRGSSNNEIPDGAHSERQNAQDVAIETYHAPIEFGFAETPNNQHEHDNTSQQQRKRKRNYRLLKILGSWLPPTIALIFVVSFELGRRKRQKDNLELNEGDEIANSANQKKDESNVIQITDQLLGLGSNGTQVFRGTLDGRLVAVKRILKTYVASADREISLLIESDGHPNVVRYFLKEVKGDFVYLALELCDLSLNSLIGTLGAKVLSEGGSESSYYKDATDATKRILHQIAAGVRHLHSLRIVHNDLKPGNILLAASKEAKAPDSTSNESIYNNFQLGYYVAKISDMGLGKQLVGQSSFGGCPSSFRGQSGPLAANGNVGIGTVGWQAPEAMRLKSSASVTSDASQSGDSSSLGRPEGSSARASRSVDIFSLGCIFYATLVPGSHPFGEYYEREANIVHNRPSIEALMSLSVEAYNLVSAMIQYNPRVRPTSEQVLQHPYFWSLPQRLSFLADLSDRLETDSGASTTTSEFGFAVNPLAIERNATQVVGLAWDRDLLKGLTEQKYRTYDPCSVRDLLRLIRNKKNHFQDLDLSVRQKIGSSTDGLMIYFESSFPHLLMHCYKVCCEVLPSDDPLVEKYFLTSANYRKPKTYRAPSYAPSKSISLSETVECDVVEDNPAKEVVNGTEHKTDEGGSSKDEDMEALNAATLNSTSDSNGALVDEQVSITKNETSNELMDEPDEQPSASSVDICSPLESADSSDVAEEIVEEPPPVPPVKPEPALQQPNLPLVDINMNNDVILWQGSTATKAMNCRGWMRGDEDWTCRTDGTKKRNAALSRCAQDPKFRTRLCNHWDMSFGTSCPMRRKGKCVFAHGPVELRIKEGKKNRWGKLVDKNGNNSNPNSAGGEDTYGAARSIESVRKDEGKWNNSNNKSKGGGKKQSSSKKKPAKSSGGGKS